MSEETAKSLNTQFNAGELLKALNIEPNAFLQALYVEGELDMDEILQGFKPADVVAAIAADEDYENLLIEEYEDQIRDKIHDEVVDEITEEKAGDVEFLSGSIKDLDADDAWTVIDNCIDINIASKLIENRTVMARFMAKMIESLQKLNPEAWDEALEEFYFFLFFNKII